MSLSSSVDALRTVCANLGLPGEVYETPSGRECAEHEVELVWVCTRAIAGWQGHDVCPDHAKGNGCRYDGTTALEPSEKPQAFIDAEAAEAARREEAAKADAITINVVLD